MGLPLLLWLGSLRSRRVRGALGWPQLRAPRPQQPTAHLDIYLRPRQGPRFGVVFPVYVGAFPGARSGQIASPLLALFPLCSLCVLVLALWAVAVLQRNSRTLPLPVRWRRHVLFSPEHGSVVVSIISLLRVDNARSFLNHHFLLLSGIP